jgi:chitosanase
MYIARNGKLAGEFVPFGNQIGVIPLVDNAVFKSLLRKSAREDVIKRDTQDHILDILYYTPALAFFSHLKLILPLSLPAVYDSFIDSGGVPALLRERFVALPPACGEDKKTCVGDYKRQERMARHAVQADSAQHCVQNQILFGSG